LHNLHSNEQLIFIILPFKQNAQICEHPMSQHEKHQYYFEKYLRNEMPESERSAFDEKLAEDASLRMAFEYYRLNRETLLAELIEEHKLLRRDNRFNKLIFSLISLTGIALAFNYFVYRQAASSSSSNTSNAQSNIFVRYIPFLNRDPKPDPKPTQAAETPNTNVQKPVVKDSIAKLEPSTDRDERLTSDLYQRDSFVCIIEKTNADMWVSFWNKPDSLQTDSIEVPAFTKNNKTPILLVEYWESPFGYKGYLLQKNTLVLYGVKHDKIILYKDQNELFMVLPETGPMVISEQSNFSAF